MTDELRAAAERISAAADRPDSEELDGEEMWMLFEDGTRLADAYLAETDPTPITEDWLRTVGFVKRASGVACYEQRNGSLCLSYYPLESNKSKQPEWMYEDAEGSCVYLPPPATLGQLRSLLTLLGIGGGA